MNVGASDTPTAPCAGAVSETFPGKLVDSSKASGRESFNSPLLPDTCKR